MNNVGPRSFAFWDSWGKVNGNFKGKEVDVITAYAQLTDHRKPRKWGGRLIGQVMTRAYYSKCGDPGTKPDNISYCFYTEYREEDTRPSTGSPLYRYDDIYQERKKNKKWSEHLIKRMLKEVE